MRLNNANRSTNVAGYKLRGWTFWHITCIAEKGGWPLPTCADRVKVTCRAGSVACGRVNEKGMSCDLEEIIPALLALLDLIQTAQDSLPIETRDINPSGYRANRTLISMC